MKDNFCTIYKLIFNKIQTFFILNNQTIVQNQNDADIIIIGVCAAFNADEERSLNLISNNNNNNNNNSKKHIPIYVYGCLSKVNPEKIKEKFKDAIFFNSWDQKILVESIVNNPKISYDSITLPSELRTKEDYRIFNPKKHFVGISYGCSFNCSYCPHKIGAGEIVSRERNEILIQIKKLLEKGAEEVVLTGTDTACYGIDINSNFSELLDYILKISEGFKIKYHIAQFNPEGLNNNFQKLVSCCSNEKVVDIQLPIQTSSVRLLKLMFRNYSLNHIQKFIKLVKEKNNNIMFRTDLIVGFPTETNNELDKSIKFTIDNFDEISVYGYEHKKNTLISSFKIPFFNENVIRKRVEYAIKKITHAKKIVHSGGQDISSLIKADLKKEALKHMEIKL